MFRLLVVLAVGLCAASASPIYSAKSQQAALDETPSPTAGAVTSSPTPSPTAGVMTSPSPTPAPTSMAPTSLLPTSLSPTSPAPTPSPTDGNTPAPTTTPSPTSGGTPAPTTPAPTPAPTQPENIVFVSPTGSDDGPCSKVAPCTLTGGVEQAANFEDSEVILLTGSYQVKKTLVITKGITLTKDSQDSSPEDPFEIDISGLDPFIDASFAGNSSYDSLRILGITLLGGTTGIVQTGGALFLDGTTFDKVGKPMSVTQLSQLSIVRSQILECTSGAYASELDAVGIDKSTFTCPTAFQNAMDARILNSKFSGDQHLVVSVVSTSNPTVGRLANCQFSGGQPAEFSSEVGMFEYSGNTFSGTGLSVSVGNGGRVEATALEFTNYFDNDAGTAALQLSGVGSFSLTDSSFLSNTFSVTSKVARSSFERVSFNNGGVTVSASNASFTECAFSGATASEQLTVDGGAYVELDTSLITKGKAGAVFVDDDSTLVLADTIIAENLGSGSADKSLKGGINCGTHGSPTIIAHEGTEIDSNQRVGIQQNDCTHCLWKPTNTEVETYCPELSWTAFVDNHRSKDESYCGGRLVPCPSLYHISQSIQDAVGVEKTFVVYGASNISYTPKNTAEFATDLHLRCPSPGGEGTCSIALTSAFLAIEAHAVEIDGFSFDVQSIDSSNKEHPLLKFTRSDLTLTNSEFSSGITAKTTDSVIVQLAGAEYVVLKNIKFSAIASQKDLIQITFAKQLNVSNLEFFETTAFNFLQVSATSENGVEGTHNADISDLFFTDVSPGAHLLNVHSTMSGSYDVKRLNVNDADGDRTGLPPIVVFDAPQSDVDIVSAIFVNSGGTLMVKAAANLLVRDSSFTNVHSAGAPLQIAKVSGLTLLTENNFQSCTSTTASGGGVSIDGTGSLGATRVSLCTFEDNTAPIGGHLYLQGGDVIVSGCDFYRGSSGDGGGALRLLKVTNLEVDQFTTFVNNTSTLGAQVIVCQESKVDMSPQVAKFLAGDNDIGCNHCDWTNWLGCPANETYTNPPTTPPPGKMPLPGWKVVLTVLGVLVGVSLLVLIVFFVARNRSKQTKYVALVNDESDMTSYAESPWDDGAAGAETITIND